MFVPTLLFRAGSLFRLIHLDLKISVEYSVRQWFQALYSYILSLHGHFAVCLDHKSKFNKRKLDGNFLF